MMEELNHQEVPALPRTVPRLLRLVVFLSCTAVALEITLRVLVGLGNPPLYVEHPTIEYLLLPGSYRPFGNRVTINSANMRSPEAAIAPLRPLECRILVLGDSIVNGGSMIDDSDLATALIAAVGSGARPVSVCNISAGSWGPGNWLAYLRDRGTFGAKFAIVVLNNEDASDAPTFAPLDSDHPTAKPVLAVWELVDRYLPRYVPWLRIHRSVVRKEATSDPLADLRDGVAELRARGVTVAGVLFPSEMEVKGKSGTGSLMLREVLESENVPVIELSWAFRELLAQNQQPFRDGVHPSVLGQRVLAERCVDLLRRLGLDLMPMPLGAGT
jgi:hypothetical protein